ncbi:hypothetical protein [Sorangium sp. So ce513]|uniref:hypothetical protein n=1 Tax=Sorangium sp. So ce513 TaxID=3133315 RepID=UPI003F646282
MIAPDLEERRYLGAVRFVEATTRAPIRGPLVVTAENATFFVNRRGLHVIASAEGLAAHGDSFESAPPSPALRSVPVSGVVRDPSHRYLPRRFRIELPRDADPAHAGSPDSLFQPVDIPLYPSPGAPTEPGWALLRATLLRRGDRSRLPGAFLRVRRASDDVELAAGLSDVGRDSIDPAGARRTAGEALVPVARLPITVWNHDPGPVLVNFVEVVVEVTHAPLASDGIPDPDALAALAVNAANRWSFQLASGRTLLAGELEVTLT